MSLRVFSLRTNTACTYTARTYTLHGTPSVPAPLRSSPLRFSLLSPEPQPNVLNLVSTMMPSSICTCSFITSPHAGAPTRPVPTSSESPSSDPGGGGRLGSEGRASRDTHANVRKGVAEEGVSKGVCRHGVLMYPTTVNTRAPPTALARAENPLPLCALPTP